MYQSNFCQLLALKRHTCEATREGDWIKHRCPECDYELWSNWQTGELKVFNAKQESIIRDSMFPPKLRRVKKIKIRTRHIMTSRLHSHAYFDFRAFLDPTKCSGDNNF